MEVDEGWSSSTPPAQPALINTARTSVTVDVDLGGKSNVVNSSACFANGEQAEVAGMMAA